MENKNLTAKELELQEAREQLMAEAFLNLDDGVEIFKNANQKEMQKYGSIYKEFDPEFDSDIPIEEQTKWKNQENEN